MAVHQTGCIPRLDSVPVCPKTLQPDSTPKKYTAPDGATPTGTRAVKSQFVTTLGSDDLRFADKRARQIDALFKVGADTEVFCKINPLWPKQCLAGIMLETLKAAAQTCS